MDFAGDEGDDGSATLIGGLKICVVDGSTDSLARGRRARVVVVRGVVDVASATVFLRFVRCVRAGAGVKSSSSLAPPASLLEAC